MKNKKIKIVCVLLLLTTVFSIGILLTGCESWDRGIKNVSSDIGGGLNRHVRVYSHTGELIAEYKGKIDIQENEYGNKILFDLNGKRVVINNAIVITEEK